VLRECSSNLDWQTVEVKSSSREGVAYEVSIPPWGGGEDITCDCPGFVFRGYCRHTRAALSKICNWTSDDPVPQSEEQMRDHVCPRCGRPTVLTESED
jgi:uncharacterized Zn finger protein